MACLFADDLAVVTTRASETPVLLKLLKAAYDGYLEHVLVDVALILFDWKSGILTFSYVSSVPEADSPPPASLH